jgi:large repetitive protein
MAGFRFHPATAAALCGACIGAFAQPGPKVTTTSLPNGTVGTAYNQSLAANGGKQPYSWSVSSGSFPNGLHLATSGMVSGTPTAAGTSNVTVEVSDANKMNGSQALAVTVTAALTITTSSLPNGTVGAVYSQTLAASGGAGGYTWSVTAGALPQGLTLNGAGTISGTPSTAQTVSFTAQVKDSAGGTATKPLGLVVYPATITITPSSLPNGTVGTAYSQTLAASGGAVPYTWSVIVGSLPQGLTLSAAGAISGTPSTAGTASFTVQVKDSVGTTATEPLSIVVNPPPLSVTPASLPNGTVGTAYSQTLAANGGAGGYTWSVSAGSLPQGLTLSAAGAISGTPSTAGTASFTVQVKDSIGTTATEPLSILINPPPLTVTTTSLPNGTVGTAYSQTLAANGGTGG